jgi:hypothetical protein
MADPEGEEVPRRRRLGGWGGCLLWVLAFVFVVSAGCAVGLVLRPDPDAPAEVATGQGWKVQVRNSDGEECVELVIGGNVRTAQCEFLVDGEFRVTSYEVGGGLEVVFARVPDGVDRVRLTLADGRRPTIEVDERKDIRYFVFRADEPVDGPAQLLDEQGDEVVP